MFGWLCLGIERCGRASSLRLQRVARYVPLWFVRQLSDVKLVRTLRYVWRHSPAQRQRWHEAGLRLADLRSPDVLPSIPFTTGSDIVERPEDYFCVPPEELLYVTITSGTKGRPKRIYLTADDLDRQTRMMGTHLLGFPGASRAVSMFLVYEPSMTTGRIVRRAIEKAGMFGLLSSTHLPVSDQLELVRDYEIDVIASLPVYLHRVTVEAEEDLRSLGVKYIFLGGQPFSEELREEIQSAWGAKVIDVYGSAESLCGIASECVCQNGLHVTEVDYWLEVVDPDTGEVLPEGTEGEVVVTTLSSRGMPLVRYRTRDLARLLPREGRCACGLPLRKMSHVRGRVDDMLILGGAEHVYPDEFDRALLSVPGVSDYQLVIEKDGYTDVLHVTVETKDSRADLRGSIVEVLLGIPGVRLSYESTRTLTIGEITAVPRGALAEGRRKSVHIIDRRSSPPLQPTTPVTGGRGAAGTSRGMGGSPG